MGNVQRTEVTELFVKNRKQHQGFTLIELIFVVVVIGILMATSLKYYVDIMDDARRSGVQFLSGRFAAAVAGVHLQWMIEGRPSVVEFDGSVVEMNSKGWPVGVRNSAKTMSGCQQLWDSLFQNPSELPDFIPADSDGVQYWSDQPRKNVCRYSLLMKGNNQYYFEYFMSNGKVRSVTMDVE